MSVMYKKANMACVQSNKSKRITKTHRFKRNSLSRDHCNRNEYEEYGLKHGQLTNYRSFAEQERNDIERTLEYLDKNFPI